MNDIRGLKICGMAAIILAAAFQGIRYFSGSKESGALAAAVREKNIAAIQATLKDIGQNHPELADRPSVAKAKAVLLELKSAEAERIAAFERMFAEIEAAEKQWPPELRLKEKIRSLEELAETANEKERVKELYFRADVTLRRYAGSVENSCLEKIVQLKLKQNEVLNLFQSGELEQAETLLAEMEKLHRELEAVPEIAGELVSGNRELMDSVASLREMLDSRKMRRRELARLKTQITTADSLQALEAAVQSIRKLQAGDAPEEAAFPAGRLLDEIAYFKAILQAQAEQYPAAAPERYKERAYFQDIEAMKNDTVQEKRAAEKLIAAAGKLQAAANTPKILFVRLANGSSVTDIYAVDRIGGMTAGDDLSVMLQRTDGMAVKMTGNAGALTLECGTESRSGYRLVSPAEFSIDAIRASVAPHQQLIHDFFTVLQTKERIDPVTEGTAFLKTLYADEYCAPFWKVKFALGVLAPLVPLDRSPGRLLAQLQKKLTALQLPERELQDSVPTEKAEQYFTTFDSSVFDRVLQHRDLLLKYRACMQRCRYRFFGVVLKKEDGFQNIIMPEFRDSAVDLFAFDGEISDCVAVGHYEKNGMRIDGAYQEYIPGRLLFTTEPASVIPPPEYEGI